MTFPTYTSRLTRLSNEKTKEYEVGHIGKFKRGYKQRGYISIFWTTAGNDAEAEAEAEVAAVVKGRTLEEDIMIKSVADAEMAEIGKFVQRSKLKAQKLKGTHVKTGLEKETEKVGDLINETSEGETNTKSPRSITAQQSNDCAGNSQSIDHFSPDITLNDFSTKKSVTFTATTSSKDGTSGPPPAYYLKLRLIPTIHEHSLPDTQATVMNMSKKYTDPTNWSRPINSIILHTDESEDDYFYPFRDTVTTPVIDIEEPPSPSESEIAKSKMIEQSQIVAPAMMWSELLGVEPKTEEPPKMMEANMVVSEIGEILIKGHTRDDHSQDKQASKLEDNDGLKPESTYDAMAASFHSMAQSSMETVGKAKSMLEKLTQSILVSKDIANDPPTPSKPTVRPLQWDTSEGVRWLDPRKIPRPLIFNPEWVVAVVNDRLKRDDTVDRLEAEDSARISKAAAAAADAQIVSVDHIIRAMSGGLFDRAAQVEQINSTVPTLVDSVNFPTVDPNGWFLIPLEGNTPEGVLELILTELKKWGGRSRCLRDDMLIAKQNRKALKLARGFREIVSGKWILNIIDGLARSQGIEVVNMKGSRLDSLPLGLTADGRRLHEEDLGRFEKRFRFGAMRMTARDKDGLSKLSPDWRRFIQLPALQDVIRLQIEEEQKQAEKEREEAAIHPGWNVRALSSVSGIGKKGTRSGRAKRGEA